ncbi:MAG: sulfite exporter TauE/SafE family protein, partial [Mesoflavibacter sp.]|nr:sulfite exporter TauE/SafE family protein [Mesoflavibacter sp.]
MEIQYILGYIGALFIGLVLGLIGGGGSILTVPILVYFLGINPITATAYSLFVVGSSALVGAIKNIQKKLVDFKTAIVFAVPAFTAVFLTRKYLVPAIPEQFYKIDNFIITKDIAIMLLFAVLMLLASISMLKSKKEVEKEDVNLNFVVFFFQAAFIGVLTGLVGAGGGFLIIPTLMFFARMSIKNAVATS